MEPRLCGARWSLCVLDLMLAQHVDEKTLLASDDIAPSRTQPVHVSALTTVCPLYYPCILSVLCQRCAPPYPILSDDQSTASLLPVHLF